jgi:hypothetical protein
MPRKNPATERIGGPGASHENHKHPEKSHSNRRSRPDTDFQRSVVSGGGGESDSHHTHDPALKGKGKDRPLH